MKKCKLVITFIIIFSILLCIPTPVNAIIPGSDTAPSTANRSSYFIPIEVAEEIHISQAQVSRLEKSALECIKKQM